MPYIYLIENKINGKKYIGQTTYSIEERMRQHIRDVNKFINRPLYRAINKYGIENFSIYVIEECEVNLLSEREVYWIAFYNTYYGDGYNATLGGEGRTLINHDLIIQTYERLRISKDVAKEMGISSDTVSNVINSRKLEDSISLQGSSKRLAKPVNMYTLSREFLNTFPSMAHAARYLIENNLTNCCLKTIRYHISEVCNGKRKTAAKFKWQFTNIIKGETK